MSEIQILLIVDLRNDFKEHFEINGLCHNSRIRIKCESEGRKCLGRLLKRLKDSVWNAHNRPTRLNFGRDYKGTSESVPLGTAVSSRSTVPTPG
jgi:hypothetical protein